MVMHNGNSTPLPNPLSASQQAALEALGIGCGYQEAAKAAGVHRTTLYRWIQSDPEFGSAYTLWQQMAREETRVRLLAKAQASVGRVIELMEKDCKFAFKVIKEMGFLKPQTRPAASVEVDDIRREIELEALEREQQFEQRLGNLVRGQEAKQDRAAAEVKEGLPAGKMQQAVEHKSDAGASAPQANARRAAERAQPMPPAAGRATDGGRMPISANKPPALADEAIASLPPITGKELTLGDELAVVGLEKNPTPAASATLAGYMSQLTQAAAQSAAVGSGRR